MAHKRINRGHFSVVAHQEGKRRWVQVHACLIGDDEDVVDFQELLAKTLPFLDGEVALEDLPEVV